MTRFVGGGGGVLSSTTAYESNGFLKLPPPPKKRLDPPRERDDGAFGSLGLRGSPFGFFGGTHGKTPTALATSTRLR